MRYIVRILGRSREPNWRFTALIGVPYCLFLAWMHCHHEMYRDELHPWTLARQARGFMELVNGDRVFDGHPPLWYWYLYVWSWFTQSAWAIQAATVVAATGAAVLLLRFGAFPRWLKVLLLCSYYLGYEYVVLSRDYVLGWLLLCVFCACYQPLRSRPMLSGSLLALLSMTSLYGQIMAISLLAFLALDNISWSRSTTPPTTWNFALAPRLLAGLSIALTGVVLSTVWTLPPEPNPFSTDWDFKALSWDAIPAMLARLVGGVLPLRPVSRDFWGAPLTLWDDPTWTTYVGWGLLLLTVLSLYPAWRVMLVYLIGVLGMDVFQQIRYVGAPRHWGHYFMFFVGASWLARSAFPRRRFLCSTLLLTCILCFEVQSFVAATISDARWVFSGGRETAAFIRSRGLQDLPLLAGPDWFVLTVTGYLGRPFIRVETDEFHATVDFHGRRRGFSASALLARAAEISRQRHTPVLLVSNESLPRAPAGSSMTRLFVSGPSTVSDEVFRVYTLTAK